MLNIRHTLSLLLIVTWISPASAAPQLTLDLDSGYVLSHQQAFDPWYPASLTKLMTAYIAFRAIQSGEIEGSHPVRISKAARKQPPSRMGYRTGTTLPLDDALKLLVIKSANDIAVAIAESISGSVEEFAHRMNTEASRLGMKNSRFVNPHGLHNARQYTTARDMALLVRAIHKDYPQYANLFSAPSVLAPSRTKNKKLIKRVYYSYNLLLERFRGGDGFKTGFVCASGYNFIGAATQSGRRIASVVLGRDSQTSRAIDAAKFITDGFHQPLTKGTPIADLKPAGPVPTGPRNMRNSICSKAARAKRYEPGAGQAVIKSPWLQSRNIEKSPLVVSLYDSKNIPTSPVKLSRVPLPKFRPSSEKLTPAPEPLSKNPEEESTIPTVETTVTKKSITLPKYRPQNQ